jgi:hypothetical protein
MTYAQGSLIDASDYNNILGANSTSDTSTLHAVWAWGHGSRGYGQTPLSTVSTSSIVTATQWATLVNAVNSANLHIRNTSSGLTANTAGQIIGHSGGLPTAIGLLNQDRLLFATNSAVIANQNSLAAYAAWTSTSTSAALVRSFGANVAFESPDKARFFFNAGGRLKFNITATADAVARSVAAKAVIDNMGGISVFGANTNGGRTGSGGTLNTNATAVGYYNLTIANTTVVSVTSTTASYTTDTGSITVRTNGARGSFNDNGDIISFWATINSTAGSGAVSINDSLSVTPTVTVDVSYPEVTNLANTWGAVTVTRQGS